jgi:hypothetical protein
MIQPKFERFFARILFKYISQGERDGREIAYIYNRQSLDELKIEKQTYDNSQFISIGDTIELEGYKCKVKDINFKLEPKICDMSGGYGINMLSPTYPTDFNCQIGIFIERLA